MKRKDALEYIRIEFATHGRATKKATRIYIENRISMKAFQEAASKGLAQHERIGQ